MIPTTPRLRSALVLATFTVAACSAQMAAAPPPNYATGGAPSATAATATTEASPAPPAYDSASVVMSGPEVAPIVDDRPGLATSWGESTWSPITTSPFVRAAATPWATAVLHYNDADGVRAHAQHLGAAVAPLEALAGHGDVAIAIIDDAGAMLPGLAVADRNLIAAHDGDRYRIAVRNRTDARFEVVASVDGLDVIDGKAASFDRRGYIVEPHGELVIDGFRQSNDQVAAFRFGRVAASYAARTSGDANVGVIGLALFAERGARWTPFELERRDRAQPFPGQPGRTFAAGPE